MSASLFEKDAEIERLKAEKMSVLNGNLDEAQRQNNDDLLALIARLKTQVKLLESELHVQKVSEGHGYF